MEKMSREEMVAMYKPDVARLVYYLPWLEGKSAGDVVNAYQADDHNATLPFPVYDEILLIFLNELSTTIFMDQNYKYIYTRYRMHDYEDELRMIDKADIMTMDILKGILSKYMLGGMTKAYLWTEGIEHQIFLKAVLKAKQIVEFWDMPLNVPMMELAPVEEELPAEGEIAVEEEMAASEEMPVEEEIAVWEEMAVEKEMPVSEEIAAETMDAAEAGGGDMG